MNDVMPGDETSTHGCTSTGCTAAVLELLINVPEWYQMEAEIADTQNNCQWLQKAPGDGGKVSLKVQYPETKLKEQHWGVKHRKSSYKMKQ